MLTFKNLGKWGRLGNQMFQYSLLYNAGKKTGFEIGYDFKNKPEIASIFNLEGSNSDDFAPKHQAVEMNNFDYLDTKTIPDGKKILGWLFSGEVCEGIQN